MSGYFSGKNFPPSQEKSPDDPKVLDVWFS